MFQLCNELEYLDLSNFNTSNVTDMEGMFNECHKLKEKKVGVINKMITNMKMKRKLIKFNYYYKFQQKGKYIIKYSFNN